MRGQREGPPIIPVGTLISLASLDSFPLKGGSLFVTKNHSLSEWFKKAYGDKQEKAPFAILCAVCQLHKE